MEGYLARLRKKKRKCDTGNNLVSFGRWTGWLRSFLLLNISDRYTISILYGSAFVLWKYRSVHYRVKRQCNRKKHFKNLCIWGEFSKYLCIHTHAYICIYIHIHVSLNATALSEANVSNVFKPTLICNIDSKLEIHLKSNSFYMMWH